MDTPAAEPQPEKIESKPTPVPQAPGCAYTLICACNQLPGHEDKVGHIYFSPAGNGPIPKEKRELQLEIERVAAHLRYLFLKKKPEVFHYYFDQLLSLAQVGLLCDQANPSAAKDALIALKETVVNDHGFIIKARYLNKLLWSLLPFILIYLSAGLLLDFRIKPQVVHMGTQSASVDINYACYCYMLAAAMASIWLSFASRTQQMTFEMLRGFYDDMLSPIHRGLFVSGFTLILALFGAGKIIWVSLGEFSTMNIGSNRLSAVIFGVICGLSERFLATTVAPHVTNIMAVLGRAQSIRETKS